MHAKPILACKCGHMGEPKTTMQGAHLRASCARCGGFLRFLKQPKPTFANEGERFAHYRRLVSEAQSAGHNLGSAAHRFRHDTGEWPPNEWRDRALGELDGRERA